MFRTLKKFVIYGNKKINYEIEELIKNEFNIEYKTIPSYEDFKKYTIDHEESICLIGIDHNQLEIDFKNYPNTFLNDLNNLKINPTIKKCVLVEPDISIKLLESCLNVGFDGFYPSTIRFSLNDKFKSLSELLNGKKHIPTILNKRLIQERKTDKNNSVSRVIVLLNDSSTISLKHTKQIETNLNVKFTFVQSISELIKIIIDPDVKIGAVLLEINESVYNDLDFFGIYDTVASVLKCSLRSRNAIIGGVVSMKTDIKLLRRAKGIIKSFTVRGSDFTQEEKEYSMKCALLNIAYLHPKIDNKLKPNRSNSDGIKLTQRQLQILELVSDRGASNKSIGRILQISESTVKLHLSAIFKKYGVKNRTQLALSYRKEAA